MCRSMVDIQSAAAEIRRGKKRRKIEDRNYRMKILWSAQLHRATITNKESYAFYQTALFTVTSNDVQGGFTV